MRRALVTGLLLTTLCTAPVAAALLPAAAQPTRDRPASAGPSDPAALTAALDLQQRHGVLLGQAQATAALRASALERAMAAELVPLAGAAGPGPRSPGLQADTARARADWVAAQAAVDALTALVAADAAKVAEAQALTHTSSFMSGAPGVTSAAFVAGGGAADPRAVAAVRFALAQSGEPYLWGATGPSRWDCSGLMMAAYRSVGVSLPRVSRQQFWAGAHVARADLLPGDLVFLATVPGDPSTIHHVGMYIGNGRMVHAPKTGDVVRVAGVPTRGYAGAVRVLAARAVGSDVGPGVTPSDPPPTQPPPTDAPPTDPPPTDVPPTDAPPTDAPPTDVPPTDPPPTDTPPTEPPPTFPPFVPPTLPSTLPPIYVSP